jgi:hypothetical protein
MILNRSAPGSKPASMRLGVNEYEFVRYGSLLFIRDSQLAGVLSHTEASNLLNQKYGNSS